MCDKDGILISGECAVSDVLVGREVPIIINIRLLHSLNSLYYVI